MNDILSFENLNEGEVMRLAHVLAPLLRASDFLGLSGPLGAGKSVFARSLVRTLMGDETLDVASPTYTLVHPYTPPPPLPEIIHIDLYRVEDENEFRELGLEEDLGAVMVVEWPERLGARFPSEALLIRIGKGKDRDHRSVQIQGNDAWKARLENLALIRA